MDTKPAEWLKAHNATHQWHPMSDPNLVQKNPPLIVSRGDGVYITDIDGKRYLDCQGGLWCVNAGHNRQEIIQAIVKQFDALEYYTLFPGSTNSPSIELSVKLCELTAEEGMKKVFFTSGGSDAVETALKISRQYWKLKGQAERIKFFSLKQGYHGVHFGGMSACGHPVWKHWYEPLLPGFYQVDSPYLYRNPYTDDHEELGEICATMLEREIQHQNPRTVAALIAEPVQGAGGVIVPPPTYWPRLRQICDKYDVLMIADEVITGLGRSGALFGSRGWGVKPDIMCMAKGLSSAYVPLGATLINERVENAWKNAGCEAPFMQGVTYTGHPIACAAGNAAVDLALKENFASNSKEVGAYLLDRLAPLKSEFSAIGDIRGKGLMIALELVKDRTSKEPFGPGDPFPQQIAQCCLDGGVLLRNIAHTLIISPPLTFTVQHADVLLAALTDAFSRCQYGRVAVGVAGS